MLEGAPHQKTKNIISDGESAVRLPSLELAIQTPS
jgi:hypothetical protein